MNPKKPLILVVENDPVQRDLMKLALERIDCHVITVTSGADALTSFEEMVPQVVLLDLFLPRMSGLEVIEELRLSGRLCQTTVLAISSLGFPEVVEHAREAGAYDFIIKPFEIDLLQRRVRKALNRRKD